MFVLQIFFLIIINRSHVRVCFCSAQEWIVTSMCPKLSRWCVPNAQEWCRQRLSTASSTWPSSTTSRRCSAALRRSRCVMFWRHVFVYKCVVFMWCTLLLCSVLLLCGQYLQCFSVFSHSVLQWIKCFGVSLLLSVCACMFIWCRRAKLKAVNTPTSSILYLTWPGEIRALCHPAPRCQPAQSESNVPAAIPTHTHRLTSIHMLPCCHWKWSSLEWVRS